MRLCLCVCVLGKGPERGVFRFLGTVKVALVDWGLTPLILQCNVACHWLQPPVRPSWSVAPASQSVSARVSVTRIGNLHWKAPPACIGSTFLHSIVLQRVTMQ